MNIARIIIRIDISTVDELLAHNVLNLLFDFRKENSSEIEN